MGHGLSVHYIENLFYPDFLYYLNTWVSRNTCLYSHYLFSTFIGNDDGAISIIDIIDPINPQLVGFCNTPRHPTEITIHNDLLYVCNPYRLGVYSFHVDANEDQTQTIAPMQLNQNYPNPFNPETTIEYSLPKTGQVNLAIYNIKGELVKELVNGVQPSGKNSVVWKGTDRNEHAVSSGIYFCRILANGKPTNQKNDVDQIEIYLLYSICLQRLKDLQRDTALLHRYFSQEENLLIGIVRLLVYIGYWW